MSVTTGRGLAAAHRAVRAYAQRHAIGAEEFRSDGSVTLTVDDRYRVQVRPASDGRIALAASLLDLAAFTPAAADDALVRLATWGAGLLRDHASGLAIDEPRERLVLQQVLPAGTELAGLESEVAEFVNVLAFWTRTAAGLAAGAPVLRG